MGKEHKEIGGLTIGQEEAIPYSRKQGLEK